MVILSRQWISDLENTKESALPVCDKLIARAEGYFKKGRTWKIAELCIYHYITMFRKCICIEETIGYIILLVRTSIWISYMHEMMGNNFALNCYPYRKPFHRCQVRRAFLSVPQVHITSKTIDNSMVANFCSHYFYIVLYVIEWEIWYWHCYVSNGCRIDPTATQKAGGGGKNDCSMDK